MTNDETKKRLEQLRRQLLGVLDGIERELGIKPRTAELRKAYKDKMFDVD